jgi:zona occludens toxin
VLTLVTGAPGAGKTLWTIGEVEKLRAETGRRVFYNGIPDVTLPEWSQLSVADLKKTVAVEGEEGKFVFDLPHGSIVVVDEVYRIWPQGKQGDKLPADVEAFAVHRHLGLDFYLLIQDRMRLHHFIRGLVGRHVHFERQFGMDRSRRFEWQRLGDPKDKWDKDAASGSEFVFPKKLYGAYKSADLHTVKKRLPWARLALIPALLIVAGVALWAAMAHFTDYSAKETSAAPVGAAGAQVVAVAVPDAASEARLWAAKWEERVKGQPHSAAFYDPTVQPVVMPKISGCAEVITDTSYKCTCNTQQGTIITTLSVGECRFYLANGWFDPTKPDPPEQSMTTAAAPLSSGLESASTGAQAGSSAPAAPPLPSGVN